MKIRVGNKEIAEISSDKIRRHPSPRVDVVTDMMIEAIIRLIKSTKHRHGSDNVLARVKYLRALGIKGEKSDK